MTRHGTIRRRRPARLIARLSMPAAAALCDGAGAQIAAPPPAAPDPDAGEIVVTGDRIAGSAIGETKPLAILNVEVLRGLGGTTMRELLQRLGPLAAAGGGGEPFVLLNGRRISGREELYDLPPEAIERVEALSREDAARFGFPPIAAVLNFITKKRFRAVQIQQLPGITTEGGGATNFSEMGATRIDGGRRLSISASLLHIDPITQRQRDLRPDAGFLYAATGNVAAPGGGSIDPALDALAGIPVTLAAVPADPLLRGMLAAYVPGANRPAVTDPADTRWLQSALDQIRGSTTIAGPLTATMAGSLNLSLDAQRRSGRNGPAPALLLVPGGGALPFAGDVLLYRALPDAVLRQRDTSLALHAGGTLTGSVRRWAWTVTAGYDRADAAGRSDQGVVLGPLQAAVAAGGDPLQPLDAAMRQSRQVLRSETLTRTLVGKATANGPVATLPAGPVQVTVTADYARSQSRGTQPGRAGAMLDLARTTRGASVNATLPIADGDRDVLPLVGRLTANATVGLADVSDYGRLVTANYGLSWSRWRPVQITLSASTSQTAPAIDQLTSPVLAYPNTPFFDFTTGATTLVTAISGGNAALRPERRRIVTAGLQLTPVRGRELRLNLDYVDTRVEDQAIGLGGLTAAAQAAVPGVFLRDAAGRLVAVDFRPRNAAREIDRQMRIGINFAGPLGVAPPPPATAAPGTAAKDVPPPPPPRPRPFLFAQVTTTVRLENRLLLRPGAVPLDLLGGATLTGTGGRPRWEVEGNVGLTTGPVSSSVFARLQGPTRVSGSVASADLRFSGRTFLVWWQTFDMERIVPRAWTKRLSLSLTVENILDDRVDVRDRNGATPARFQPAFVDPVGRSVRVGVRKLF